MKRLSAANAFDTKIGHEVEDTIIKNLVLFDISITDDQIMKDRTCNRTTIKNHPFVRYHSYARYLK